MPLNTKSLIENAYQTAEIIGEGDTSITTAQYAVGLRHLQHLIRVKLHPRRFGFGRDRLRVQPSGGRVEMDAKYGAVTHVSCMFPTRPLKRCTEDKVAAAQFSEFTQPPSRFAPDYSPDGQITILFDTKPPDDTHLIVTAHKRAVPPASLDAGIDIPSEWETPLEYALAVLLASVNGLETNPVLVATAESFWSETERLYPALSQVRI